VDATASATASQKALDAARAAPIWLLVALFLSTLMFWRVPGFLELLPETAVPWLPLASTVLGFATLCRIVAELIVRATARRALSLARDRETLTHLYRPLFALFLNRHVTIATGTGAPRFRHRWENACAEIGAYRRRSVGLKRAWHALFDRQSSTSAEIEFRGNFPMAEILKLVRTYSNYADVELLELVRRADRSLCEEADSSLLTDEELTLFQHILGEHERLSRRKF
jgi:hypothetical protein